MTNAHERTNTHILSTMNINNQIIMHIKKKQKNIQISLKILFKNIYYQFLQLLILVVDTRRQLQGSFFDATAELRVDL